jgi:homoserine dehydrogenase
MLKPLAAVDAAHYVGKAYLRLLVKDEAGVIAAVSETLAEAGVSIDSFLQKPVHDAEGVPIVLTTHATPESVLMDAVARIGALPQNLAPPKVLRIAPV